MDIGTATILNGQEFVYFVAAIQYDVVLTSVVYASQHGGSVYIRNFEVLDIVSFKQWRTAPNEFAALIIYMWTNLDI